MATKNFQCSKCQKYFSSKHSLNHHMYLKNIPCKLICNICGIESPNGSLYEYHQSLHETEILIKKIAKSRIKTNKLSKHNTINESNNKISQEANDVIQETNISIMTLSKNADVGQIVYPILNNNNNISQKANDTIYKEPNINIMTLSNFANTADVDVYPILNNNDMIISHYSSMENEDVLHMIEYYSSTENELSLIHMLIEMNSSTEYDDFKFNTIFLAENSDLRKQILNFAEGFFAKVFLAYEQYIFFQQIASLPRERGYVYFIFGTENDGRCKLGSSTTLKRRIAQLQVGNADKLYVYKKLYGYKKLETLLHDTYKERRIRNTEWFNLSKNDVDIIVSYVQDSQKVLFKYADIYYGIEYKINTLDP